MWRLYFKGDIMRNFFRIFSIILLVSWMGLIFYLSSQTADESSSVSGGIIQMVAERFYPQFEEMSAQQQQEIVESFQFIARKTAHLAIFTVMGILSFMTFISYNSLTYKTRCFLSFFVSGIYAASDEAHQYFVPGRSCELRDFLIDLGGILLGFMVCALFILIIKPLRVKTAYTGKNKKTLVNLTNELYEKLDFSLNVQKQMEEQISEYKDLVKNLEEKLTEKEKSEEVLSTQEETELMEEKSVKLSADLELGASIIGKTVIEVTKICNELTLKNIQNSKDLVNLALGRTEVLKAKILKIVECDLPIEQKQDLMQKEQDDAYDYFDSLKAQIS